MQSPTPKSKAFLLLFFTQKATIVHLCHEFAIFFSKTILTYYYTITGIFLRTFFDHFSLFLHSSLFSKKQQLYLLFYLFGLAFFFLPAEVIASSFELDSPSAIAPEKSCGCLFSITPSASNEHWSNPGFQKNDLQENQLSRSETVSDCLCLERDDWPIFEVLFLTEKPLIPVLKKIFLRYKLIRAGPAA